VLAAALTLLAACGGGGGADGAAAANNPVLVAVNPPAAPAGQTVGALAGWNLVWQDEFDTPGLPDAAKWDYDTGRNRDGWYNNELQYYARARAENTRVEGGKLIITARRERLSTAPDFGGQNYTSARLLTRGLASWTYGFFEVRAKLPCGRGTWPAIWMLGAGGTWPDDGEIDIMEQTGQNKGEVLGTIHTRAFNYFNGSQGGAVGSRLPLANACTAFHNYQLTWDANRIVIGVDGLNYSTFNNPENGDRTVWPFDAPQFLLLNVAVGGDLGGFVEDSALPSQMEVEYVRVYQR
jgi:beta-glucanase (GH16 family)